MRKIDAFEQYDLIPKSMPQSTGTGGYCKGICPEYRAKKGKYASFYEAGMKWCVRCETWIDFDGRNCPCCNQSLRIRSHHNNNYNNKIKILRRLEAGETVSKTLLKRTR